MERKKIVENLRKRGIVGQIDFKRASDLGFDPVESEWKDPEPALPKDEAKKDELK